MSRLFSPSISLRYCDEIIGYRDPLLLLAVRRENQMPRKGSCLIRCDGEMKLYAVGRVQRFARGGHRYHLCTVEDRDNSDPFLFKILDSHGDGFHLSDNGITEVNGDWVDVKYTADDGTELDFKVPPDRVIRYDRNRFRH